jgi:hypothetical protein
MPDGTRVDLDRLEVWAGHQDHTPESCAGGDVILLKLAAELRAAREVVEAVRPLIKQVPPDFQLDPIRPLASALVAYDQAVGS